MFFILGMRDIVSGYNDCHCLLGLLFILWAQTCSKSVTSCDWRILCNMLQMRLL